MDYRYTIKTDLKFEDALFKVKSFLREDGFGILSEINVRSILREKLGIYFDNYIILGACHPGLSYKALKEEVGIGVMLPCNVILYEQEDSVYVSSINPTVAMSVINNGNLAEVAKEVELKLQKIIDKFV